MENSSEQVQRRREPADPNREAGQSADDPTVRTGEEPVTGQTAAQSDRPKVPPASETWVEGQPTSDADYGEEKPTE